MSRYKKKTDNPNMGRKKKQVSIPIIEKLAEKGCTQREIESVMETDIDTLQERIREYYNEPNLTFSEFMRRKKEAGNAKLRQVLYEKAISKSAQHNAVGIFFAKNNLGMSDKVETGEIGENEAIANMTDEERKKRIDELMRKRQGEQ